MNKLLLNNYGRNHIKIMPLYENAEIPEDEGDKIRWCESKFKELEESKDAIRLYSYKNRKKGYSISVWQLNDLYYLIQCIRNHSCTYNDVIYIGNNKDDLMSIAKFLQENVVTIMKDYKQQILDARDYLIKNRDAIDVEEEESNDCVS